MQQNGRVKKLTESLAYPVVLVCTIDLNLSCLQDLSPVIVLHAFNCVFIFMCIYNLRGCIFVHFV